MMAVRCRARGERGHLGHVGIRLQTWRWYWRALLDLFTWQLLVPGRRGSTSIAQLYFRNWQRTKEGFRATRLPVEVARWTETCVLPRLSFWAFWPCCAQGEILRLKWVHVHWYPAS